MSMVSVKWQVMNSQEAFDIVVKHLIKQNKKSDYYGQCVYRSSEGLKCAIGCLIPDKMYSSNLETKNIGAILIENDEIKELLKGINEQLLYSLQSIHDSVEPFMWKNSLYRLAKEYHLTWPEV